MDTGTERNYWVQISQVIYTLLALTLHNMQSAGSSWCRGHTVTIFAGVLSLIMFQYRLLTMTTFFAIAVYIHIYKPIKTAYLMKIEFWFPWSHSPYGYSRQQTPTYIDNFPSVNQHAGNKWVQWIVVVVIYFPIVLKLIRSIVSASEANYVWFNFM